MESSGYTQDFIDLNDDLRKYSKFIATLIRLQLMDVMVGRILAGNYSQIRFEALRASGLK